MLTSSTLPRFRHALVAQQKDWFVRQDRQDEHLTMFTGKPRNSLSNPKNTHRLHVFQRSEKNPHHGACQPPSIRTFHSLRSQWTYLLPQNMATGSQSYLACQPSTLFLLFIPAVSVTFTRIIAVQTRVSPCFLPSWITASSISPAA